MKGCETRVAADPYECSLESSACARLSCMESVLSMELDRADQSQLLPHKEDEDETRGLHRGGVFFVRSKHVHCRAPAMHHDHI